jgi:hypothetical protein
MFRRRLNAARMISPVRVSSAGVCAFDIAKLTGKPPSQAFFKTTKRSDDSEDVLNNKLPIVVATLDLMLYSRVSPVVRNPIIPSM